MQGSGAALTRANAALSRSQSLSTNLASVSPGADGASHIASGDMTGGTLWTTLAGFITALLGGQVTHSLPARAQMIANHVPAAVTTIMTSGYTSQGDGGAATYIRAIGPFADGSSFQSGDGAWWQLSMPAVSLSMFGAVGGTGYTYANASSLPDDTTAIQNAITYAIANRIPLAVPARQYRFTKSLNCGKAYPFDGHVLYMKGLSNRESWLFADLSESCPAFDFTNQNRGLIANLWIETTATSLHTCVMLLAETQGSGANLFVADGVSVTDYGAASKHALCGISADQFHAVNSSFGAQGATSLSAVYFGRINHGGITSKFYAFAESDADETLFLATNSQFMGGAGPGLWVQGFNQVTLTGCYLNVGTVNGTTLVGHSLGMFRVGSGVTVNGGGQVFSTVVMTGCRFEDQGANHLPSSPSVIVTGSIAPNADGMTSTLTVTGTTAGALALGNVLTGSGVAAQTTVLANVSANVWTVSNQQTVASTTLSSYLISSPCVYVEDYIYESSFQGWFNTSGAGCFGGPGQQINSTVKVGATNSAPWFNNSGALIGGKFHFTGGSGNIGLFDQANSYGYEMGGRIGSSWANVVAAIGTSVDKLVDDGTIETAHPSWMRSERRIMMPYTNAPANYRMALKGESGVIGYYNNSYVGGSGNTTIGNFSLNLPGALRFSQSASFLTAPLYEVEILGFFASGLAAGTTITISIQQALPGGTKYAPLATLTGIPAYGAAKMWKFIGRFSSSGSDAAQVWSTIETLGSAPVSDGAASVAITSGGFDITQAVPFIINIAVNSPTSNPLGASFMYRVS